MSLTDEVVLQLFSRTPLDQCAEPATVSIIVPLAGQQDPSRVIVWRWLSEQLRREYPEWELVTGVCDEAEWIKQVAVANALKMSTGSILVLLDADCWPTPKHLREAVLKVASGVAGWAIPHNHVRRLTEEATHRVLREGISKYVKYPLVRLHSGVPGGGCAVVRRSHFDAVGGFLPVAGWGFEDEALGLVLDKLAGTRYNTNGTLWHLWHKPQPTSGALSAHAYSILCEMDKMAPARLLHYYQSLGQDTLRFADRKPQ